MIRLAFHTQGNSEVGMGHVFRCFVLCDMLVSSFGGAEVTFVVACGEPGKTVVEARHDGTTTAVDPMTPPDGDWDILVIDRLPMPSSFVAACRQSAKCLVVMDDTGPGRWHADIAVNALYRGDGERPRNSRTRELEGLRYIVIDPAFAAQRRGRSDTVQNILLTQGGSDTYGLLPVLADTLVSRCAENVTLHLHLGPAFRFDEALRPVMEKHASSIRCHRSIDDMTSFYAGMDLAVSAGGIMATELAASGVPSVLVTGEEKELETMDVLAAAGAAVNCGLIVRGDMQTDVLEKVGAAVCALVSNDNDRERMSVAARLTIDGLGAKRIADAVVAHVEGLEA